MNSEIRISRIFLVCSKVPSTNVEVRTSLDSTEAEDQEDLPLGAGLAVLGDIHHTTTFKDGPRWSL